jgi:DNA-directed RNA polymerase subunit RPC12/RpoP
MSYAYIRYTCSKCGKVYHIDTKRERCECGAKLVSSEKHSKRESEVSDIPVVHVISET